MTKRNSPLAVLWILACATLWLNPSSWAGHEVASAEDKLVAPQERGLPAGSLTIGGEFSEDLSTGFVDAITPFWAPGNAIVFLNARSSFDDESQSVASAGLGIRYLFPAPGIILGANVNYDGVHGRDGSDFDQLGVGVELLSRWVDARFNYYLPEGDRDEVTTTHRNESDRPVSTVSLNGRTLEQTVTSSDRRQTFRTYEAALEGWNGEVGVLLPGLDRYMEVRVFGGYYHYVNPFGSDYEGFKARLEARLLPGVIADLEYWDDAELMGGHWTAGVRVQVPFSIFNLCTGRNPFEGTGDMFRPRKREFSERLAEMVIRSHRVKTVTSGPILVSDHTTIDRNTVPIGTILPSPPRPQPLFGTPPPPTGGNVGGVSFGSSIWGG